MKRIMGISGLALTEDEKNFILSVRWCRTASIPMKRSGSRAVLDLGEGGRHPAGALHRGDVEGQRLVA